MLHTIGQPQAVLGRCPWDGAAGEAHTGRAGSRLDAGTLSTALSPQLVVPEPPQTQSPQQGCEVQGSPGAAQLPALTAGRGSATFSHQLKVSLQHQQRQAWGSCAWGLCTGDTRQKLQGSMTTCSVGIFLLAVVQTHIQCLLNVILTGCCSACWSPGNLALPAS